MPANDKRSPLEATQTQWQTNAERIRNQMEPLRDAYNVVLKSVQPFVDKCKTFQNALEPVLKFQERRAKVIDSVLFPKFTFPDTSSIGNQIFDFHKSFQESISPALGDFSKIFHELPTQTQEALLLLGQHGWYIDPEMSLPALWQLKSAFLNGNITEAENSLAIHFEDRLSEIEESISTKFPNRAHILRSAFTAHRKKDYVLCIPILLAQTDGICKETVDQHLFIKKNRKPSTAIYVGQLATETFMAALLSPLATTLPIGATEHERDEGFSALNRHMVLHGESLDYGTKLNSLKTISLVNYVTHFLPIDTP